MLKYFNTFDHPDISSNLEDNPCISFWDSSKKRIYETRKNEKRLMICPFLLKYFNNFEHQHNRSNLEENCLISFRDSNKKQIYGTGNSKRCLMICPFCCHISTILSITISALETLGHFFKCNCGYHQKCYKIFTVVSVSHQLQAININSKYQVKSSFK